MIRIRHIIWKEGYFCSKKSSGIGMEFRERKNCFIEYNILRDVDTIRGDIETLDTFVLGAIAKEHTFGETEHEFTFVVGTKIGPACAPKNTERLIVWFFMEKSF